MKPIPASQPLFHDLRAHHHVHAHLAAAHPPRRISTEVAVAVLGHRHARARHHEGRGGGDVERPLAVAAGADDVHRALGRRTFTHLSRITLAAAAYSATLSPRARIAIRRPPICAGVAVALEQLLEGRLGLRRGTAGLRRRRRSGVSSRRSCRDRLCRAGQEILQQRVAVFGPDALGVELHALDREGSGGAGP
jgi:hypothetical protein